MPSGNPSQVGLDMTAVRSSVAAKQGRFFLARPKKGLYRGRLSEAENRPKSVTKSTETRPKGQKVSLRNRDKTKRNRDQTKRNRDKTKRNRDKTKRTKTRPKGRK